MIELAQICPPGKSGVIGGMDMQAVAHQVIFESSLDLLRLVVVLKMIH